MAANVESMFYVGDVPWHGLGINVENAPSSEDALIKAGLDWSVVQYPVFVNNNVIKNYKANVRDKDNSVLGIISDKYKIVQNKDAFSFTDALLTENVKYETAGSLQHGKKVWMLAQLPEQKVIDDVVNNYLCFTNSHDGTGAIKVMITPVRVVCNNTLNLALKTAKRSWSTRHMGDMESKLLEAKRTLELASDYLIEFNNNAIQMASQKINNQKFDEFLDKLFPAPEENASNRKIINIETVRNNLKSAYQTNNIGNFKGTAWGVINAVSDMVSHSTPLRQSGSYRENLWGKIMEGHEIVDQAYDILQRIAA